MLALTVIAIMKWNLSRRFYGNAVRTSPVKFEFSDVNFRISLPIQMAKIIYRKQDGYSSLLSSSLLTRLFVYFYVSQWNFFYKISIYALICFTCEKTCWMCSSYYLLEIYVFIDWVDGMDSKLIYFLSQYSKHSVNFIRHSFKLLSPCPCLRLYQKVFHLMH